MRVSLQPGTYQCILCDLSDELVMVLCRRRRNGRPKLRAHRVPSQARVAVHDPGGVHLLHLTEEQLPLDVVVHEPYNGNDRHENGRGPDHPQELVTSRC